MISKKISCKPENHNFRRLGNYIADASHEGEKSLMAWQASCMVKNTKTFFLKLKIRRL